ncbi:MAG: AAA family ATPase [Deltaproteobacteria bacterium]|nr:AAA family ATPase [Deltaproteobacteria bacterium]MBV8450921.1 AAA family ATPase [Deltaproteobacteria bacterium]
MGAAPNQQISPVDRVAEFRRSFARAEAEIGKVIVGHREVIRKLLTALLAGGHVLIEGVPGLGKTLLVKTAAETLGLSFKRIQFTPDLMPSDIIGTQVLTETNGQREFNFKAGPIFAHVVLGDEINRATPKTQSAVLEAMEERQVTVFGTTYLLELPFFVLATQNPIELEGTYPLPEAQMDRFLFKVVIGAPKPDELREILNRTTGAATYHPQSIFELRQAPAKIEELKLLVREVMVAEPLERYIISIIGAVTPGGPGTLPEVSQYLRFGPSPRGAQALILCAKVNALLDGRASASYDDVNDAIVPSLRHRLLRNFQAEAENVTSETILEQALKRVKRSS